MRKYLIVLFAALAATACGGSSTQTHHFGGRTHSQAFLNSVHNPKGLKIPSHPTVAQQIPGYDAVTASAIPYGAQAALCYANGRYANCTAVKARGVKHVITIAVNTSVVARLIDTEPGDATPSQDGGWVKSMIYQHHIYRPGVYADSAEMPAVRNSLSSAGLKRSQYVLMVASWDGNPTIPIGYDGKQWKSTQSLDYDSFASNFFASTPAPAPKPAAVICWGKGSTPTSKACKSIEMQAHTLWVAYLAFDHGYNRDQKLIKTPQNKLNTLNSTSPNPVSVTAYKGLSVGFLSQRITEEKTNKGKKYADHKTLVDTHTGH